jgi:phenylpyruvate tautomerase PptA (4-oxalocrotonate tautomerase family)
MKETKLTVTFHIGGKQVDKLTEEQKERMAQRLSEAMSTYYTAHPEEYAKIKK